MATEKTMTMREFLTAVSAGSVGEVEMAFAKEQIAKMDEKNASRASKNAEKTADEFAPLIAQATEILRENGAMLTSVLAEKMGVHPSKVTAIIGKMGDAVKTEKVTVTGKGKRVQVSLAE